MLATFFTAVERVLRFFNTDFTSDIVISNSFIDARTFANAASLLFAVSSAIANAIDACCF